MKEPALKDIDKYRKEGFRPGVVCFLIHKKTLLLLFKKDYKLWLVPQGGIEPGEDFEQAIRREVEEELGKKFLSKIEKGFVYLGDAEITLNTKFYGEREMETEEGEKVNMKGKKYFFYAVAVKDDVFDIKDTDFDEYFWLEYEQAKVMLGKSYQLKKREINLAMLEKLKEIDLI
jgi:8-oxo-dGTP pyrophosphatase MutT (NUDIX family)